MKKLYLSILYVVFLSILISGTILFSKPQAASNRNTASRDASYNKADKNNTQNEAQNKNDKALRSEDINIFSNQSKLDLHANLAENSYGLVSLNLAYRLDGKLVTKSIDASGISEIRNIFGFREKYRGGYTIKNMQLNEKMKRLYFCVEGKKEDKYSRNSIYSFDMDNSRIEKIFFDIGEFDNFILTPDGRYNACTYLTRPQNVNERRVLLIFNCESNKLIFNSNSDINTNYSDSDDLYNYSYSFAKWRDNNTCELRQQRTAKDGLQKETEKTLLYNISFDKLTE